MENLDKHLNNPLYIKAKEDIDRARDRQIRYGASKYPETFNPKSWTDEELYEHLLGEVADELHYARGLYERIKELRTKIKMYEDFILYWEDEYDAYFAHAALKEKAREIKGKDSN